MMTKKPNSADALSIATQCDSRAAELRESLPTIAQLFTDAGAMIRAQHEALSPEKCLHVITFTVTKDMVDSGRESRPIGKYCMTCGELVPPPPKPKREKADKKTEAAGDGEDNDQGDEA
jgi:hypothetical protein